MAIQQQLGVSIGDLIQKLRSKLPDVAEAFGVMANSLNNLWNTVASELETLEPPGTIYLNGESIPAYTLISVADGIPPTTDPLGGTVIYAEAGALKAHGSSGTITTIAPAEPHCPACGADFVLEWNNPKYGHLVICMKCFSQEIGSREWIRLEA